MHALVEECGAAVAVSEERGCRGRASIVVAWDVVQRAHLCREEIYHPVECWSLWFGRCSSLSTWIGSSFPPHGWGQQFCPSKIYDVVLTCTYMYMYIVVDE